MSVVWEVYIAAKQEVESPEAKFLAPCWVILSTLAYRVVVPARVATEAGEPVRQPYARVAYIPQSGTKNLACRIAGRN